MKYTKEQRLANPKAKLAAMSAATPAEAKKAATDFEAYMEKLAEKRVTHGEADHVWIRY